MSTHTIHLNLGRRSYNIIVGAAIVRALGRYISRLNIGRDAYVITNAHIKNRHGKLLDSTLLDSGFTVKFKLVADTEKSKSLGEVTGIIRDIMRYDQKKKLFIVAFGGGVIGDLAGFIASIYKRGIAYVQVPTTLLAQVDSSIGGKTAVDLSEGKNLVGAFYQPRLVLSDIKFLKTLSQRQLQSGLAEVIKYAIIKDSQLFAYLERNYREILDLKQCALEFVVLRCSYIKAKIIQQDEREEKGMRTILNFGHTIGHALEAASGFKGYNHGEAISIGMLVAGDISRRLRLINNETLKRIENLIGNVGLPAKIKNLTVPEIIKAHYRDKKFIGSRNKFVLIKGLGKTKIVQNLPLEIIEEALKDRIEER